MLGNSAASSWKHDKYCTSIHHLDQTSRTTITSLGSDEKNIWPLLAGTDKSTLMINPKPWLKQIFILREKTEIKLIVVTENR